MNPLTRLSLVAAVAVFAVLGCNSITPGEDPLVVRVEQTESTAKATFDFVLRLDHSDRGFWRTNAPAFHKFCEWLRVPQAVNENTTLPRASAMIWGLNEVKGNYLLGRQSSNDVITALTTLQGAVIQAEAWKTLIITPHD